MVPEPPKPRVRFIPKDCTLCVQLRKSKGLDGKSYVKVYGRSGGLRYCKCEFCGNTWKQFEKP